jgi:hypothetical protein
MWLADMFAWPTPTCQRNMQQGCMPPQTGRCFVCANIHHEHAQLRWLPVHIWLARQVRNRHTVQKSSAISTMEATKFATKESLTHVQNMNHSTAVACKWRKGVYRSDSNNRKQWLSNCTLKKIWKKSATECRSFGGAGASGIEARLE